MQGKASAGRYNGKMVEGFDYANLKAMENKTWVVLWSRRAWSPSYGPAITNDDLPNLRGAYLQEYVGKNYKVTMPVILDGKVSKSKKSQ